MTVLELRAPAKVNLGLRVVGRRRDGYHELESLFLPLELSDRIGLEVEPGPPEVRLVVEGPGPDEPAGDDNLAARAARAFLEASGRDLRVRLGLRKRIPMGAGLGGGSSDAGTVLRALSRRFPGVVPDLGALALGLGADVPFFLDPRPAWVTGIGERIQPLSDLPSVPLLLLLPDASLATAAVFAAWDASGAALTPQAPDPTISALSPLRRLQTDPGRISLEEWAEALRNDLEPAAVSLCPGIAGLGRRLLEAGALAAGLSGSGPCVYGLFRDESTAETAEKVLRSGGRERVFRTRTVASS